MNKCEINDNNQYIINAKIRGTIRKYRTNTRNGEENSLNILKEDLSKVREDVFNTYILPGDADLYFAERVQEILNEMEVFKVVPLVKDIESWFNDNVSSMDDIEERNPNSELIYVRNKVTDNFLYKAYGLASEVREMMELTANEDLSEVCFISRGKKFIHAGTIDSNEALNDNIRAYQLKLLNDIIKYLKNEGNNVGDLRMYDENKNYTGALELLDPYIDAYLSNISADTLSTAFNQNNYLLLDAYNASVLLHNFDSYLVLKYGDMIKIRDFNRKVSTDKYQISKKTSKLQTNWRTTEDINPSDETGYITKFLIGAIPFHKWGIKDSIKGLYLTFLDYQYIVGKIKDLVNNSRSTELIFNSSFRLYKDLSPDTKSLIRGELRNKSLRYLIAVSVKNPKKYIHALFDVLTLDKDLNVLQYFSTDEKDKLYTIAKGVFVGSDSIRELNKNSNIDYYSYILQSCNSIYEVKHIQYQIDDSGKINTRFLIDNQISKLLRRVENSINEINSIKFLNWGDYKDKYNIRSNYVGDDLRSITFTIPNTNIEAEVNPVTGVKFTENGSEIKDFSRKRELIPFIDEFLLLGMTNLLEQYLSDLMNGSSNMINDLASLASKIIFNLVVSKDVLEGKSVKEINPIIKSIYGELAPKYNQVFKELNAISRKEVPIIKLITRAVANLLRISTSVQVLDSDGNTNSRLSLSRLATSFWTQVELQELNPDSATNHFILWKTPGLFKDTYIVKEFYNARTGKNIPVTRMSPYDLTYCGFILDFVRGLLPNDPDNTSILQNGKILLYPFICSDKNMMFRILVDLNTEINSKKLINFTNSEFRELISSELGTFYQKMINNISSDLNRVDLLITQYNAPLLSNINNFDAFNEWFYANKTNLNNGDTPVEFINNIVTEYNVSHRLNPIRLIDLTHFIDNNGRLSFNLSILDLLRIFTTVEGSNEFWNRKEREIIKTLLTNKFVVNTTNTNYPEIDYIRKFENGKWINLSGDMIIAKLTLGKKSYDIVSDVDIKKINYKGNNILDDPNVKIELNPLILKYNNIHFLFSLEYTNSTVGVFTNHPAKKLPEEFFRSLNLIKRNNQASAALLLYVLNLLEGIPDTYNISVILDASEIIPTIPGVRGKVTIYDGATWINPFTSILENLSLGEQAVGNTKKFFIHFKDEQTGTGGNVKTAGFSLNNDNIRNCPFFKVMMKKMTNHAWLNLDGTLATDINIKRSWKGSNTTYDGIYYRKGNKYYNVVDFDYINNNTYVRTIQEVSIKGNPIGDSITEEITINSNYDLWNFFGGEYSMSLVNGNLKFSNASCENVVKAMNNAVNGHYEGSPVTQDDLWQPLKHSDIHYVVTEGAIKLGAANINSKQRYYDNVDYNFFKIKLYQAGIQLDKEHEADDSDVSLPTLIINACVALGYNYELSVGMYNALYEVTRINTNNEIKALQDLLDNEGSLDFRNIILKRVVESILNDNSLGDNFIKRTAQDLIEISGRDKGINRVIDKIPISDNELYVRIQSIINVFLTKSGIRQKMPGALLMLTPSHGIYKLYNTGKKNKKGEYIYDKYETFINPEEDLKSILNSIDPVFDIEKLINNIQDIELGRNYIIVDDNGNYYNRELVDPKSLRNIRAAVRDNKIRSITEDITKGRDLVGYNVRFKTNTGEYYQVWELDSSNMSYELYQILSKKDILGLQNFYDNEIKYTVNVNEDNFNTLCTVARTYVNRLIQKDLANLSPNRPKYREQYNRLLSTFEDTPEWYKKYAEWVNIRFKFGNGYRIGGNTVNSDNFDNIDLTIRRMINDEYEVSINGTSYKVDESSIKVSPYEAILPKIYATKFGLDEFCSLLDILNDEDYFLKQYINNLGISVNPNLYSVAFKRSNGDHIYVLHKSLVNESNLIKVNDPLVINDNGIWYKSNYNGDLVHELDPNYEIYEDSQGREVIVTDDIAYYTNNLHYLSIQLSDNLGEVTRRTNSDKLINDLCRVFSNSTNDIAVQFGRLITSNGITSNNILDINKRINTISIDNLYDTLHGNILKACREKYNSFVRSLDVISGRTPAQCLQSFMSMRTAAFDNSDLNNIYVSIYQILLQGSDFDIDTASTLAFDISRDGILKLWSPYAKITSSELMEASEKLPFPTGKEILRAPTNNIDDALRIFEKYKDLINIVLVKGKVLVSLNLNTPELIELLGNLLRETKVLYIPNNYGKYIDENGKEQVGFIAELDRLYPGIDNLSYMDSIYDQIAEIINNHNLYISKLSINNRLLSTNNYITELIFNISNDPINMMQSHAPVDRVTEPWKEAASKSELSTESVYGNVFAYFNQFFGNLDSKAGVGIAANGLKGFYALKEYNNRILNEGTEEELSRLLIKDINIGGEEYKTLANIMPTDPNTIINDELREALALNKVFSDMTLDLSALLSLAVDNAKDNILVYINATTKTLGMFTYGLSLGVPNMTDIMTSKAANIYMQLLKTNSFLEVSLYSSSNKVFAYFESLPYYLKSKYETRYDKFVNEFKNLVGIDDNFELNFTEWAKSKTSFKNKLKILENIRSKSKNEEWNKLIDEIEEYTLNLDSVKSDKEQLYVKDLKILADGAEELRTFTSILALNQGIRTTNVDYLRQIQALELVIYNRLPAPKGKGLDNRKNYILDVIKFAFDDKYRLWAVNEYEKVKHTFNILDAIDKCPQYLGYVLMLAMSSKAMEESFKYRTLRKMSLLARNRYGISPEFSLLIDRGIIRACSDYVRLLWMLDKGVSIYIPKDQVYFDLYGNEHKLLTDFKVLLGTDPGDATFRRFMEYKVIPDLKNSMDNKFIKDLRTYTSTQTISNNPTMIYSLSINMSPRLLSELSNLHQYIAEFNKLSKSTYDYKVTTYDSKGNPQVEDVSIPIVDLFTYYIMIANKWTSGERSLLSILRDFKTEKLIQDFHDYEVLYDLSKDYLDDINYIEPYVLPHTSFWQGRSRSIYALNPNTGIYQIMRRVSRGGEDDEYSQGGLYGKYISTGTVVNVLYFDKPIRRTDESVIEHRAEIAQSDDNPINYTLIFDDKTGNILSIDATKGDVTKENIQLPLKQITYSVINGEKVVDLSLIESIVNKEMNC